MIGKKSNAQYDGLIPEIVGDRFYGQDYVRDHWYWEDRIGAIVSDAKGMPCVVRGGVVTKGSGDTLNITECIAYAKYDVEIPDSFASLPPTKTSAVVEGMRIVAPAQVNMSINSATLDGSTWNYVKLRYKEIGLNSRARAKRAGTYYYEIQPSYEYIVNSTAPTEYDATLCRFKGSSGGSFTFDYSVRSETLYDDGWKVGCYIASDRLTGSISRMSLPSGKVYVTGGFVKIGTFGIVKVSQIDITPSTTLDNGYWYLVYIDIDGNISYEKTTGTTYAYVPIEDIDTKAPINSYNTARYKADNPSRRCIGAIYVMPSQTAWSSGTTYSKGQLCSSGGNIYISLQNGNTNRAVSDTSWWYNMGQIGNVIAPRVWNVHEPTFGTAFLGDVTLNNNDIIEVGYDYTDGTWRHLEYHFKNLTLSSSATVHIGRSADSATDIPGPVEVYVKNSLIFNSGSSLNGRAKGITGGAGGTGSNGNGGAGANSGFPLHLYVNNVIDKTSGNAYIIDNRPGTGSNGATAGSGTGGGGGSSTSGLYVLYRNFKSLYMNNASNTPLMRLKIAPFSEIYFLGHETYGDGVVNVSAQLFNILPKCYANIQATGGGSGLNNSGSGGICGAGGAYGSGANNRGGRGGFVGEGGQGALAGTLWGAGGGGGLGAGGAAGGPSGAAGSSPTYSHLRAGGYFIIQQITGNNDEVTL